MCGVSVFSALEVPVKPSVFIFFYADPSGVHFTKVELCLWVSFVGCFVEPYCSLSCISLGLSALAVSATKLILRFNVPFLR